MIFCQFQVSTIREGSSLSRVKQEFALVHASILTEDFDTEFLCVLCDLKYAISFFKQIGAKKFVVALIQSQWRAS